MTFDEMKTAMDNASYKAEAEGWVYFSYNTVTRGYELYKARSDGSEFSCIAKSKRRGWDAIRNIRAGTGWIYFNAEELYSVLNEECREYDHYTENLKCKIKTDGTEFTELNSSGGYRGSSD